MTKYKIVATKIEYFEIEVDAESQKEALEFAREHKELFKFYREDEINILEASLKAMRQAAESVLKQAASRKIKPEQCVGLIDGNKIPANLLMDLLVLVHLSI
jgi:HAMP domain-containing protein